MAHDTSAWLVFLEYHYMRYTQRVNLKKCITKIPMVASGISVLPAPPLKSQDVYVDTEKGSAVFLLNDRPTLRCRP